MSLNNKYTSNPYNPTFGTPPSSYIHRYDEESRILNEFCAQDAPPMSYMILGARGMGKTVLMHELANRFESFAEWVVVRMNPNMDLTDSLMRKLSGHKKVSPIIKSAKINLSFFSLSLDMKSEQIKDAEDAITEILKGMQKNGKKLLIIIDEATNTDSMKKFASTYQNLIGQKLPVYLLMTGLYENINSLKNEKNLTFLYRMPRIQLSSLNIREISENYKDVFLLNDKDALKMARYTKGYSYAFQLLGKLSWDKNGDYESILDAYRRDLYEMVYDKIWDEMSDKDRALAYSIAISEDNTTKSVRKTLGWKTNELSPYKDRLTKKGVIDSPEYGRMEISLPYFKGYIIEHHGELFGSDDMPEDL